jgi:pyruvate dehydrogenase E1 component beta subunit
MPPRQLTFCQAINEALHQAMAKDDRVFIMGEGVDDPRAIFGSTIGLQEKFGPERVFDIPLSENGMTGVLMGAALAGMRPVMTHQRVDFTLYAMDQLVNHAAKRAYTSGGKQSVPFVVRAIIGRGWGQGTQHSQSIQALYAHVPGLKVIMPSNAYDAKGLLLAAIEDNNPVLFIEHRRLFDEKEDVPEKYFTVPLGQGNLRRKGKDLTIVATSLMVLEAEKALDALQKEGITGDLIDLRSMKPIDQPLIVESVKRTGRLIAADTGWKTCGIAAEVAAIAAEHCFTSLKAPVHRIVLPDIPTPNSYALEPYYYPGPVDIVKAACQMLGKDPSTAIAALGEADPSAIPAKPKFVGPF